MLTLDWPSAPATFIQRFKSMFQHTSLLVGLEDIDSLFGDRIIPDARCLSHHVQDLPILFQQARLHVNIFDKNISRSLNGMFEVVLKVSEESLDEGPRNDTVVKEGKFLIVFQARSCMF